MKLYELTDRYRKLSEQIDELDEAVIIDTLEAIEEAIDRKVENTLKFVKTMDYQVKLLKEEEERLATRRKTLEGKSAGLKDYIFDQLLAANIEKLNLPLFTAWIQDNPPKVDITDEKQIPEEFKIQQPPKLDKRTILERLKNDEVVPGTQIIRTKGLRIR